MDKHIREILFDRHAAVQRDVQHQISDAETALPQQFAHQILIMKQIPRRKVVTEGMVTAGSAPQSGHSVLAASDYIKMDVFLHGRFQLFFHLGLGFTKAHF